MTSIVRIIPCIEVNDGQVVNGVNFTQLLDAGDLAETACLYEREGADEITFLDNSASATGREKTLIALRRTSEQISIPITVGAGIRKVGDVELLLQSGASKVSINTASIIRPELIAEIADRFGSQALVISVDLRRARTDSGFEVATDIKRESSALDALAWIEKACALGAGEILLNSMDADGTRAGYDIGMIAAVRAASTVPLIASGGVGGVEDFSAALDAGADAFLASSVFHLGVHRIGDVKSYLSKNNYSVRNARTA